MIRIICADISRADGRDYERLYEKASEERKRKADRYRRYEDKLRCVAADALLRAALGAEDIQIEKNEYGKPYIKNMEGTYFNLSHSGSYVVIAVGESEIGIDVQRHGVCADMNVVAELCFTRDEQGYARDGGQYESDRFYEVWTGKESYLKYIGKGFCEDARSFGILGQRERIRCLHNTPCEGYTLSFCSADKEYTLELSDVRQLG